MDASVVGEERQQGLRQAIARREVDVVAAWSVDRLGRSLQDLVAFLGELKAKDVDLYLHQQGLDTGSPPITVPVPSVQITDTNTQGMCTQVHTGAASSGIAWSPDSPRVAVDGGVHAGGADAHVPGALACPGRGLP